MRIVVIGCGFHGRGIAYELAEAPDVDAIRVADLDGVLARRVAERIGADALELDVHDRPALKQALAGMDLVFNAIGPYHYRDNALTVVQAAIEAGVSYVDMNDDHEPAEALLLDTDWDRRAKEAGIAVLTGTGIAPGVTAVLARLGIEALDRADRVEVSFTWNYSLQYPAALHHFFRINSGLAPQYIDRRYVRPGAFAAREVVEFLPPVGRKEVWYTGVIDPVSLSHTFPQLNTATAKGAYHQPQANRLLEDMVHWGMTNYDEVAAFGTSPFEFLMACLRNESTAARFDIPIEDIPMPARVEVTGERDGRTIRLNYEAQDFSRRATTSAAAQAALLVARGETNFTGVRAPEGCIDPRAFLGALAEHPDIRFFAWEGDGAPAPMVF